MKVERLTLAHLEGLALQPAQALEGARLADATYRVALTSGPHAYAAVSDDGTVLAACGCVERWEGVATAWALISGAAGRDMHALVRAMRGYYRHAAPWRRVETHIDVGFSAGERLALLLDFQCEGIARAYRPDGGDCTIWARIRA